MCVPGVPVRAVLRFLTFLKQTKKDIEKGSLLPGMDQEEAS